VWIPNADVDVKIGSRKEALTVQEVAKVRLEVA
jgi:hypothetical protein